MKPFTQTLINNLKRAAIEQQDYQFAAIVRHLEKNNDNLSELEIQDKLCQYIAEFNEKHIEPKQDRVGDCMSIDPEIGTIAKDIFDQAHKVRGEAETLLVRAAALSHSAFEVIRKKYPEFCQNDAFTFNRDSNIIAILK